MRPGRFFNELSRRHVLRVMGAYAVFAWVSTEVYTTVQPLILPQYEDSARVVVILLLLGFPVVFALSWIYDITPEGLKRTAAYGAEPEAAAPTSRGRRMLTPRATGFFGLGILVALVAFAAVASQGGLMQPEPMTEEEGTQSIAVLPFSDLSAAGDQQYLSDGLAEEIQRRLAQLGEGLRVSSRGAAFAFRGDAVDVTEVGRLLGVQWVLLGSLQRDGNHVRVNVTLSSTTDGRVMWSDHFDGDASDLFVLQDSIATAVMDRLRVQMNEIAEAGRRGTTDVEAQRLLLQGRRLWHQRTGPALLQARDSLLRALALDAEFAEAYAALAQTYALLPIFTPFPVDSAVPLGYAAAARAIEIRADLPDAWAAMGQLTQNYEWYLTDAESSYRRALDLGGGATVRQWYAETLMLLGRYAEAADQVQHILQADGMSPLALHTDATLKTLAGQQEDALVAWRTLVRLHPEFELGLRGHAYAAIAAGRNDEAARTLDRLQTVDASGANVYRAVAAALRDPALAAEAKRVLAAAEMNASERAAWSIALGNRQGAVTALVNGHAEHTDVYMPFMLAHPLMKTLRNDAAVRPIIAEIGLRFS